MRGGVFRGGAKEEVEIQDAANGAKGEGWGTVVQKEGGVLWRWRKWSEKRGKGVSERVSG